MGGHKAIGDDLRMRDQVTFDPFEEVHIVFTREEHPLAIDAAVVEVIKLPR